MRINLAFIVVLGVMFSSISWCDDLPITERLVQKRNVELKMHIGGAVFKVTRTSPLPNAFGKADMFGRKVDRGFMELRFLGVDENGKTKFRLTDVETTSNETTMSRTPISYSTGSAQVTYNPITKSASAQGSAITFGPPEGSTESLPPNTTEFQVDTGSLQEIEFGGIKLLIKSVNATQVTYVLK